jgi:winged helix DNA-binding protein
MTPNPDPAAIIAARLRAQRLIGAPFPTAKAAVGFLACVQSQDPLGATWSLGMRVKGATERSLITAYDRGEFLRTHILRPTWHYVLPEDIRWILDLTAPHILRGNGTMARKLELTPAVLTRAKGIIAKALDGGTHLTREELSTVLARGKVAAQGQRMAYVMMDAELTGLVCSGAMKGKQHTYALLDERVRRGKRVGGGKRMDREEGVAELLRRFVRGHGPTTVRHFSWWSGIGLTEARRGRAALGAELEVAPIDGTEWLSLDPRPARSWKSEALLVPEYDEVLVGTADIGIPRMMADRRMGKKNNTFDRPLLFGGEWIGTWRRTVEPKRILLEVEPFGALGRERERALAAAAARYAEFAGKPVDVR